MKKKILFHVEQRVAALLLILPILLLSPVLMATKTAEFSDVSQEAWYAPYVKFCAEQGLLNGVGNGQFDPQRLVNGDEAMVMAARALWQADGGAGALPQGLTLDEATALLDQGTGEWYDSRLVYRELTESWSWDGFCYLTQRGLELDAQLPWVYHTYPATRQDFFTLLALAGRDLPVINRISAVPGCRDEGILHLYRAGILSGADGYGSFEGQRHLTRAEAAAALARLSDPALRLRFTLEPPPWTGYTLTKLAEGMTYNGIAYPVLPAGEGILTLSGEIIDYPPGQLLGGTSIDSRGEYLILHPSTGGPDWKSYTVLVDADGNLPFPVWTYDGLYPLSDGTFLALTQEDDGDYENHWTILNADGSVARQLPSTFGTPDNDWYDYNEGLCPWRDEESGLMGYVDGDGAWVIPPQWSWASRLDNGRAIVGVGSQNGVIDAAGNYIIPPAPRDLDMGWVSQDSDAPMRYHWSNWAYHNAPSGWIDDQGNAVPGPQQGNYCNGYFQDMETWRYYDLSGTPCSESFDWCGPINAQGQGFVSLGGVIYRINFK